MSGKQRQPMLDEVLSMTKTELQAHIYEQRLVIKSLEQKVRSLRRQILKLERLRRIINHSNKT